jgi:hypothetical protein
MIASLPAAGSTSRFPSFTFLSKEVVFEAGLMLSRVEPQAWLTDVLEHMVSGRIKAHELERLLPWTRQAERVAVAGEAWAP